MNVMYPKSQIDPSILTPKSDLYPKIWDPNTKKLNANIKLKLKQIAEDFVRGFKYPLKIKDIILTGSIANYNWNQYSDIDLHVLLDFNEIPDEYMGAFKDYFNAKKEIWNKTHNIMIIGHEVEVYIQDINEPHYSTGVYSVLNDRWITEPQIKKQEINYDDVISRTEDFIEQINKTSELLAKKDYQKAKIAVNNLKKKIKKYRQAGLESGEEYSTENLVFKMLRNQGYLETLSNLKFQAYDSDMSIEEEILNFQNMIEEGKKDACYYKARAKYKVWPSAYASGYLVRCRKKKGNIKEEELEEELELDEELLEELAEEVPQPGESSGKPKEFKSDAKPVKKKMTIGELISQHPDIPYYKDVLKDYKLGDYSWAVTTKVLEYAKYLKNNPESVKNLPPIIFIDNNINDGAHRTSALYLLANELDKNNPFWKQAELKVYFYNKEDTLNETTFDKEKSQGLHGWFSRRGGKGKSKGWVDCNTCRKDKKTGRKTCKTCGRQSGEKRGKYPACRPTPSACTKKGMKNKKSSKQVSWKSKKEE